MQTFPILDQALFDLKAKDPLLAELIAALSKPERYLEKSLFIGLLRLIGADQISQEKWRSIWQSLLDGLEKITPETVLNIGIDGLLAAGFSIEKAKIIIAAAEKFSRDNFQEALLSDDIAIRHEALLSLPGVQSWMVERLDIFYFAEADVFSESDDDLRLALANLYGIEKVDDEAMARAAERFMPYRSTASLYLWQSLSLPAKIIEENYSMEAYLPSPVGPLYARVGKMGIAEISFTDLTDVPVQKEDRRHPLFRLLTHELEAYFAGDLRRFTIPIDRNSGTPFQQQVWKTIIDIPYGEKITYGDLAKKIGRPTAYRAVANALGRNPVSIVAPCHRIIGANGKLTGFGGGLPRKRFLLDLEKENS